MTATFDFSNTGDWRDRAMYYKVGKKCCVCGSTHEVGTEPRFGYPVCELHSQLSPVQISEQRKDGK